MAHMETADNECTVLPSSLLAKSPVIVKNSTLIVVPQNINCLGSCLVRHTTTQRPTLLLWCGLSGVSSDIGPTNQPPPPLTSPQSFFFPLRSPRFPLFFSFAICAVYVDTEICMGKKIFKAATSSSSACETGPEEQKENFSGFQNFCQSKHGLRGGREQGQCRYEQYIRRKTCALYFVFAKILVCLAKKQSFLKFAHTDDGGGERERLSQENFTSEKRRRTGRYWLCCERCFGRGNIQKWVSERMHT